MAPDMISAVPRYSTNPVHKATAMETAGESSDFTRRAASAASTVARLTSLRWASSVAWAPNACTTRADSRPCCTTAMTSL